MDNPFTYGNPISDPARFFGRQREVEQVVSRLRNIESESSSLVGDRRIGKTSLLNYLAHPDVRRAHGLDPERYIFTYVDLELVDRTMTPARLWQRLLRLMARNCRNEAVKSALQQVLAAPEIDTFALADLFDSMDDNDQHVVFLLDEFEKVTENPNFGADFFYGLRSLAIHSNLSLITSSRRELIELCHSESIRSSPFFNIFANINVRLLTEEEARDLIATQLASTSVHFGETELAALFRIAGYHPYFLQAACHFLFEAHTTGLDASARSQFLLRCYREEATPHFEDYWRNSDDHEKIVLTAITLLQRQGKTDGHSFSLEQLRGLYGRSGQALARLEKRGLLVVQDDSYRLFSASYADWIATELTEALSDEARYEDWLRANQGLMERLSGRARSELGEVLPKVSSKYRELIITWVSDPRNLVTVAALLKGALGFG